MYDPVTADLNSYLDDIDRGEAWMGKYQQFEDYIWSVEKMFIEVMVWGKNKDISMTIEETVQSYAEILTDQFFESDE
jgi:hypothetical protein